MGSHFEEDLSFKKGELTKHLSEARSRLELADASRDETVGFMVGSFGEKILELEEEVQREREARGEGHRRMLEELQVVEEQVAGMVQLERREGAAAMGHLEGYLEELCFKIERQVMR